MSNQWTAKQLPDIAVNMAGNKRRKAQQDSGQHTRIMHSSNHERQYCNITSLELTLIKLIEGQ